MQKIGRIGSMFCACRHPEPVSRFLAAFPIEGSQNKFRMTKVIGLYCYCEPIAKIAVKMLLYPVEIVILGA